jgi:SNF2 family DNA or RNA helicase
MLRESVTSEDQVFPFAHQLELLAKLFSRKPVRALIGDEIGLGKTISAIMAAKYLIRAEGIKKVLILVPRVLVQQWLTELRRFNLEAVLLERNNITRKYEQGFPEKIYIASIDLVKKEEYKKKITSTRWDLIIVDEAHRVGKIGGRETQRYLLVKSLVENPSVNLLLLSATPHRGKPEDYVERLKLVDPYLKAGTQELDNEDFYRLCLGSIVFRRVKQDVNEYYEKTNIFTNCKFKARLVEASDEEKAFHRELMGFLRRKLLHYYSIVGEEPKALPLLMALIAKRASSSPRSAMITLERIIRRRAKKINLSLSKEVDEHELDEKAELIADTILGYSFEDSGLYQDESERLVDVDEMIEEFADECSVLLDEQDIEELKHLYELGIKIRGERDSRLNSLIKIISQHVEIDDKIVIFTEFRDTAKYIFEEIRRRLPEISDKIALVTSREIIPPQRYEEKTRKYSIEDVKKWLRKGDILVLVSTDVASEGLNLQVANVVVHYEPTWSPIKIVQRIGRLWRIGQEKDVHSYSLLLTVESDIATLEVLYGKLLSWMISGIERSVPIGEELEIDMMPKDKTASELLQLPIISEKGRPQYSEYKAWIEFIVGGEKRLKSYVESIIRTLVELKKHAERLGLTRIEPIRIKVKVENLLNNGLGNLYGKEADSTLKDLLILVARLNNTEVEEKESGLFIKGTNLTGLKTSLDMYRALTFLLKDASEKPPIILIAKDAPTDAPTNLKELHLYKIVIYLDGRPTYSEVAGVEVYTNGSTKVRRGLQILKILIGTLHNITGVVDQFSLNESYSDEVKSNILPTYRRIIVHDFERYLTKIEERFGFAHKEWIPRKAGGKDASHFITASTELLGVIVVPGKSTKETASPPPIAVEEVERKAMEYAMEYEKKNLRIPEDVSKSEHYDIRSVDPRTHEERFIEVKGRWGLDITVDLTETEFELAKRLGDKYWLYIVYGFSTSNPRLLAINDPVNKLKWSPIEVRRYRLTGV